MEFLFRRTFMITTMIIMRTTYGQSWGEEGDWVVVGDRYVKYHWERKRFWDAEDICGREGGTLVYDDNELIHRHLMSSKNQIFLTMDN